MILRITMFSDFKTRMRSYLFDFLIINSFIEINSENYDFHICCIYDLDLVFYELKEIMDLLNLINYLDN